MAIIRKGNKKALLVVDVQVGVMQNAWNAPQVIKNIITAVEKARTNNIPVIWVQHSDEELLINSPDWQLVPKLLPANGELQIQKNFNSAFEQTPLDEVLARYGTTQILLAGAATNWCIRATAYGALDRGYDLTLIKDAHTTESIELEDGTKVEAADIILDLNIAMKWLSYPGRINRAVSVNSIDIFKPL
jgi:nicotinamidase-related amidase